MTHTVNNVEDRIGGSSCIGKRVNTWSSLSHTEGSNQDWKKDLSKRTQEEVISPILCLFLSQIGLLETHATLRMEFRFIPYFFFFLQKGKIYKVNIAFHCTMGFFNLTNISLSSLSNYLLSFSCTYRVRKVFIPTFLTLKLMPIEGNISHLYYYSVLADFVY